MAISDTQNTLSWYRSRVLTSHRDMSAVPCKDVAGRYAAYAKDHNDDDAESSPEGSALWFYGMNHFVSLIAAKRDAFEPLTPAEATVLDQYHEQMGRRAARAFYYLLMICIRESRHNKSLTKDGPKMAELFGAEISQFFVTINGGESSIHSKFLAHPPKGDIGNFVQALRWQFYKSKWNGGYGGAKWGVVSDCLVRFVFGEYSPEMMLDTVWTLSHNGGPIFNKGLVYQCYSPQYLLRVLDLQRSGQIPEAVLYDTKIAAYVDDALRVTMVQLLAMFPDAVKDHVDWHLVKALGGLGNYEADKVKQMQTHGLSPAAAEAEKLAAEKAKLEAAKAAAEKAEWEKTHFVVMPDVAVKKFEMERVDG